MKPAGPQADFRAVASMLAIKNTAAQDFKGLTGSWVGALLWEGGVFRRQSDSVHFLSLGFVHQSVFLWKIHVLEDSWR